MNYMGHSRFFRKVICILLTFFMLSQTMLATSVAYADDDVIAGKFSYVSHVTKKTEKASFSYDSSWFKQSSFSFNKQLCQMSIRMSMAGMNKKPTNIKSLYDALGIEYTNESISFAEPTFDYDTNTSSIGYAIGNKKITDENGNESDLVVVTLRGGGYTVEWGSNMKLSSGDEHSGFSNAAEQVTTAITNYISTNGLSNLKIWITGYSRGASVSNIVAHNLNNLTQGDSKSIDAEKSDIYAYCFEPSRTVRSDNPEYKENSEYNIYNIINDVDFVTKLAPVAWNFVRYGVDYYVPSYSNKENFESKYYPLLIDSYTNIIDSTSFEGDSTDEAKKLAVVDEDLDTLTDDAIDVLTSSFKSQSNYYNKYEKNFCNVVADYAEENGTVNLFAIIKTNYPTLFASNPAVAIRLANNADALKYAHYSELCMAWIDAIDNEADLYSTKASGEDESLWQDAKLESTGVNISESLIIRVIASIPSDVDNFTLKSTSYLSGTSTTSSPLLNNETGEYEFLVEISPSQMSETFKFELQHNETTLDSTDFSVSNYCDALANDSVYSLDTKMMKLLASTLAYGEALQIYEGYDTENLATKSYSWITSNLDQYSDAKNVMNSTTNGDEGAQISSAFLCLDDQVSIVFKIYATDTSNLTAKLFCNDIIEEEYTVNNSSYIVKSSKMAPYNYKNIYELVLYRNGAEIQRVTYSVGSYVARKVAADSNTALVDLCKSIWVYGMAAQNFKA